MKQIRLMTFCLAPTARSSRCPQWFVDWGLASVPRGTDRPLSLQRASRQTYEGLGLQMGMLTYLPKCVDLCNTAKKFHVEQFAVDRLRGNENIVADVDDCFTWNDRTFEVPRVTRSVLESRIRKSVFLLSNRKSAGGGLFHVKQLASQDWLCYFPLVGGTFWPGS